MSQSAFAGLMNMITRGNSAPAAAPTQTPGAPAPVPNAVPAGVPANSGPAAGTNQPAFQQSGALPPKEQSPLAEYADIWNTPTNEGAAPLTLDDPFLNVDKDKVKQLVDGMTFAQATPEQMELMQKALQGDIQSFAAVLNNVAQSVYYNAAMNSAHVAEAITRNGVTRLRDHIPQQVRTLNSAEKLYDANPGFNNPALRPMVDAIQSQFQLKNPTASPQQIAEMTKQYFINSAHVFAPDAFKADNASGQRGNSGFPVNQDFSNW